MKTISGIYKIVNLVNGKLYIGQSKNIHKRLTGHKKHLSDNKHQNQHLQRSWNKYGKSNFEFKIIEICDIEELTQREIYWINLYESYSHDKGYNIDLPNEDNTRFTCSKETRKKLSESNIKYSKEELISYLHEFYYMEGRVPNQRDFKENKYGNYPSFSCYVKFFGNLKSALLEANLYDFVDKPFSKREVSLDEVIDLYNGFIEIYGRFPNSYERREATKYNLPAESTIQRKFGSITAFKDYLGFTKEMELEIENLHALKMLKELYNTDGYITSRTIDNSDLTRSVKFYSNRFGSLENAYKLAGIPLEIHKNKKLIAKRII